MTGVTTRPRGGNIHPVAMEPPIVCPYCCDRHLEPVPEARLYAENVPRQTTALSASVFRCSHWHVFATFPLEPKLGQHSLTL